MTADPNDRTIVLHMKLDRETVRVVDMYAAQHDLYRNEAAARLIRQGVESQPAPTSTDGHVSPEMGGV